MDIPSARGIRAAFELALLCCASLSLPACSGGGSAAESAPPLAAAAARAVDLGDVEIAQLLYADSQRTPAGFYKESAPSWPGYIATAHLKNTDLGASAAPFELCTDDWSTALSWSDQAASALSASTLVDTSATSRYHEFMRTRATTPPGYVRTRVYRCSYLDRSGVDLHAATGAAGQLNQRPLSAAELQQLVEYLWQFTAYNNYGHAVLKSSGASTESELRHALVIASLHQATPPATCDRIDVFEWRHTLDLQSGALQRRVEPLWEYGARRRDGLVELCNPF